MARSEREKSEKKEKKTERKTEKERVRERERRRGVTEKDGKSLKLEGDPIAEGP